MNRMNGRKRLLIATLALGALLAGGAARAGTNVQWSIGINAPIQPGVTVGTVISNGPVYAPAPVVYAPAPVVYSPAPLMYEPAPVYVRPAPVVYAPAPVYVRPAPVYVRPPVFVRPHEVYGHHPHWGGHHNHHAWERERARRHAEWLRHQRHDGYRGGDRDPHDHGHRPDRRH